MRDINRIDKFCEELKTEWKKYPDYRFGQMMMNVFSEMVRNGKDPFYPEDKEMMAAIKGHMSKITRVL